jgi:hypothetical protein
MTLKQKQKGVREQARGSRRKSFSNGEVSSVDALR